MYGRTSSSAPRNEAMSARLNLSPFAAFLTRLTQIPGTSVVHAMLVLRW